VEDTLKLAASISLAAIACAVLWAETLNVKTGQWEATMTMQTAGLPPIPQEVLDKMTPQQRQMMEQRMKGNQAPRTTTTKTCVTKEDLEKAMTFGSDDKACTRTIVSATGSKQEIHIECNRDNGKMTGTIRVEASNSESVKGSSEMTMTSGGRSMSMNGTFSGKWIASACEKDAK
jgi:hypothetical protein